MTTSTRRARYVDWLISLLLVLLCLAVLGPRLRVGWIPSDEGTLAASAFRVLQGQLPHRDFREIYTGGLSFVHGAAFRLLGVNLYSLRLAVFLFFLAWVPVLYFVLRRFLSPLWAVLATLTGVAWSYPNYMAAMPSWYNLFLATFGAAALLRFLEVRTSRWLFVAGVCGGASVLIKVVGLYYIGAALLFLLSLEQDETRLREDKLRWCGLYLLFVGSCLLLYLGGLTFLLRSQLRSGEIYHFLLPSLVLVTLLLWREREPTGGTNIQRFRALARLCLPFLAGVLLTGVIFLAPYAASGSVGVMLRGVGSSAGARVADLGGRMSAPGWPFAGYGAATMVLLVSALYVQATRRRIVIGIIGVGLLAVLLFSIFLPGLQDTWLMAGMVTPSVVLLGAWMIVSDLRAGVASAGVATVERRQQIMLLISLAALCSLVQFPLPYVTYFCYTAPLTLLAAVACVSARRKVPGRILLGVLLVFFLLLGVFGVVAKHIYNPDLNVASVTSLQMPRAGGLMVDGSTQDYEQLIQLLKAHAENGLLYAGNDCPELYFLSGLRNPTSDDTGAADAEVLAALRSGKLGLVVFNDQTFFATASVSEELREEVAKALPQRRKMGRFTIFWR